MLIKYEFATGEVVEIDVPEDIGNVIIEIEHNNYNSNRKETRRHESLSGVADKSPILIDPVADIEADVIANTEKTALHIAIAKLQPQQKELVDKLYFQNMKIADVARLENVTEGAIRNRVRKILAKLKKYLT